MAEHHPSSSGSSSTVLGSIEDVLLLALQCGDNLAHIQSVLVPALQKLLHHPHTNADLVLSRAVEGDKDPLTVLNPSVNTIAFLYILTARLRVYSSQEDVNVNLALVSQFVENFSMPQSRCAGYKVGQLARQIAELGDRVGDPSVVIPMLEVLFHKFTEGRPHHISNLYPVLAYQYLKASQYEAALDKLVKRELIDVDVHAPPSHADVLEYFYYSGMILAKLKLHEAAIDAFETCISSPSATTSAIQIDAYKKLLLVQLLAHGKTSPPPRYTAQAITRSFKQLGAAYISFASAYESRDADCVARLETLVNSRAEVFTQDCNFGLVWQCLELHRQRRIQRLGDVYSSLTLRDVADLVNVQGEDREEVVRSDIEQLMSKGWIVASIHPSASRPAPTAGSSQLPSYDSPVVVFEQESKESYDSIDTVHRLMDAIKRSKEVQRVVEQRERTVARSVEFLKKQAQASSRGGNRYLDIGMDEFEDDAFAS